jgi:hypothetical protein
MVPIVLKSGSLNLLEPLKPVKACNGIDLPLSLHLLKEVNLFVLKARTRQAAESVILGTMDQV